LTLFRNIHEERDGEVGKTTAMKLYFVTIIVATAFALQPFRESEYSDVRKYYYHAPMAHNKTVVIGHFDITSSDDRGMLIVKRPPIGV